MIRVTCLHSSVFNEIFDKASRAGVTYTYTCKHARSLPLLLSTPYYTVNRSRTAEVNSTTTDKKQIRVIVDNQCDTDSSFVVFQLPTDTARTVTFILMTSWP